MKKLFINGKEIKGIGFVYDGCHKIFVVENDDLQDIYEKWGENETIYPLEEIEQKYNESCSLRFVYSWKVDDEHFVKYVSQFENANFKWK